MLPPTNLRHCLFIKTYIKRNKILKKLVLLMHFWQIVAQKSQNLLLCLQCNVNKNKDSSFGSILTFSWIKNYFQQLLFLKFFSGHKSCAKTAWATLIQGKVASFGFSFWAAIHQKCIKWTAFFSILFILIYVLIKNRHMQDLKIVTHIYYPYLIKFLFGNILVIFLRLILILVRFGVARGCEWLSSDLAYAYFLSRHI